MRRLEQKGRLHISAIAFHLFDHGVDSDGASRIRQFERQGDMDERDIENPRLGRLPIVCIEHA